jgi:Arc/MetJ family transcription regulator
MAIKRKSHNLDADLLQRAQQTLGVATQTEAIHEALRAVLVGEHVTADLAATGGRVAFRRQFVRQMQRERRHAR